MDYEIVEFIDQAAFRAWLAGNAKSSAGIWLKIYKKNSGTASIAYDQALDEALCYGWIDGQKKSYDEHAFLQKFTPRRPKSMWSKKNIENIERLTKAGLITEAGLQEVRDAQADGRWAPPMISRAKCRFRNSFWNYYRNIPRRRRFIRS